MTIKMAASVEQEIALKHEVKENLDKDAPNTISPTPVRIKKEEPDDEKEVLERLDRENRDMFEDVDEDVEYVDLTYEGFAEINGVEHFVCERT